MYIGLIQPLATSAAPLVTRHSTFLAPLRRRARAWTACALVALALLPHPSPAQAGGNTHINGFRAAKTLLRVLYAEHPCTLYSDCRFTADRQVDYAHCKYEPRVFGERAHRIEWEHIVPAEAFGRSIAAWRKGDPSCVEHGRPYRGRRCASKASAVFRHMEADLYNLVPEIGELNQRRSNRSMAEILPSDGEALAGIGGYVAAKTFAPRDGVKGDVARTYLYMDDSYPAAQLLSHQKLQLFAAWAAQDPVDVWECRRAYRIEAIQGNENRFVKTPCLAAQLWPAATTYSHEP